MTHKMLLNDDEDDENRDGSSNHHHSHHKLSPLRAILYTSPTTTLFVIPLAIGFESSSVASDAKVESAQEVILVIVTMLFVATLVFILLLSEYWLVNATSSLALSVAGVLKELITIGGGLFFFSEHLDMLNVIGFALCQIGILMYVRLRYDENDKEEDQQDSDEVYMTVDSSVSDGNAFGEQQQCAQQESFSDQSGNLEFT